MRQRIPSEGSFPAKPGEYWRTNSREPNQPTTPVSEEEAWSPAANKPWTGKKGSAGKY